MNSENALTADEEKVEQNVSTEGLAEDEKKSVKPDKKIAVTAFVLGLLGLFFVPFVAIIAIILGHIASSDSYDRKHKKLSHAAIILGYIHIGLIILISIGFIAVRTIMVNF